MKNLVIFLLLRPTNPLRNHNTICKAWSMFKKNRADSLRAVIMLNNIQVRCG